jgi:HAD superfamily hydrolase (TIGR01490 family)
MDTAPTPALIAFCDVDETLIACKSMFEFLDFFLAGKYGSDGADRARGIRQCLLQQAARGVPREEMNKSYFRAWTGESAAEVTRWGQCWFDRRSAEGSFYLAPTRDALAAHRAAGAALVLVSGSFPALLDPIARDIGAARVLCTRPEERHGRLTGEIIGAPMIGTGKREAVHGELGSYPQIRPADCYAYGDHASDLPMLEAVGHPVVVGADPELLARLLHAQQLPSTTAGDSPQAA